MKNMSQLLIQVIISMFLMSISSCGIISITSISEKSPIKQFIFSHMVDYEYFYFESNMNPTEGLSYIIFEVTIQPTVIDFMKRSSEIQPILCYNFDKDPILNIKDKQIDVKECLGFDYNQYYRANGKYSLKIQIDQKQFQSLRILVFISGYQIEYNVSLKAKYNNMLKDICPFNCYNLKLNQFGECENSQCKCPINTIDYDCSQNAKFINLKQTKLAVNKNNMEYIYFKPEYNVKSLDQVSDIILSFQLVNKYPKVDIYISIEGVTDIIVPTKDIFFQKFTIEDDEFSFNIRPNGQYNINGEPKQIIIGFLASNINSNDIQNLNYNYLLVTISESPEDNTSANMIIIYFLVSILSLIFFIWIILTIIKIRNSKRNQVADFSMAQAQNLDQQRQQLRRNQNKKLTIQLIDQFLPSLSFEEIKKKLQEKGKNVHDSCAVCLCEFEDADICRETICCHYFHKNCIELWLQKQENCPFCRTDLSHASLANHYQQIKDQQDSGEKNGENQSQKQTVTSNTNNDQQNTQGTHLNRIIENSVLTSFHNNVNLQRRENIQSHLQSNATLIRSNADRMISQLGSMITNQRNSISNYPVGIQRNNSSSQQSIQSQQQQQTYVRHQRNSLQQFQRQLQSRNSFQIQQLNLAH